MKMRNFFLFLLPLSAIVLLQGCLKDNCTTTRTFVRFDPVYKTAAECRSDLVVETPQPLKKPGKIYAYDHYLFINELEEGIHVIDNADPANPVPLAFWRLKGNVDLSIRDHYLYADQYMDLLSFDITDLQNPELLCRKENEFTLYGFDPYRGYIIAYNQTNVTEEVPCDQNVSWFWREDVVFLSSSAMFDSGGRETGANSALAQAGVGGSYARFAIDGDYFYTVDHQLLRSYSLSNPACPSKLNEQAVGWEIETIFPWKDKLFIGSQQGVFIMSTSNPSQPTLESNFWHATGCDPVVCDDKYAYVTIHDGTTCNGTLNQLEVIGIEFLPNTSVLATYNMKRPMGLALTDRYLYLCDDGLKVFDKLNPTALQQLSHVTGIETYDVIAFADNHILVIGADGLYQYDMSKPTEPKQISVLPVQ